MRLLMTDRSKNKTKEAGGAGVEDLEEVSDEAIPEEEEIMEMEEVIPEEAEVTTNPTRSQNY